MTTRSKEANVDVAEKKEMIGTLAKFQVALEKIDSYHHVVLPPLYRQVGCFATIFIILNLLFSDASCIDYRPYSRQYNMRHQF